MQPFRGTLHNQSVICPQFQCCGVAGRFDFASHEIPVSCCHIDYGTVSPFECGTLNAYDRGCATELGGWLAGKANALAIVALVVTCIQVSVWLKFRVRTFRCFLQKKNTVAAWYAVKNVLTQVGQMGTWIWVIRGLLFSGSKHASQNGAMIFTKKNIWCFFCKKAQSTAAG